jgi:hypothetical protein
LKFRTTINATEVVIDLPGVSEAAFKAVGELIDQALARPAVKNRDLIKDAYLTALKTCPKANASDLWHHVVYRQYGQLFNRHRPQDPKQSWVRASGEALELAVEELYSEVLLEQGIRIQMLLSKPRKFDALQAMGIETVVGSDKLDVALFLDETNQIFGGVHVKASLAERISDDVPCSRAMMSKGYFSPLWTLDVKSFPPPHGDLVNRGELGTPTAPTEKRRYVGSHGDFDHLFSANARTVASLAKTDSGKRVIVLDLANQPDSFAQEVLARAKAFKKKGKAESPPPSKPKPNNPSVP